MKKILLLACLLSGTASQVQAYNGGRGGDSPTATGAILLVIGAAAGIAWDHWYTDAKRLKREKEEAREQLEEERAAGKADKEEVDSLRAKLQQCEDARSRMSAPSRVGTRFSSTSGRDGY